MADNEVKKLAGQTVIYGGSTVLARLLNYLLVPLHTYIFQNASDYGVVGELYAWTSLFIVILTYGMALSRLHLDLPCVRDSRRR